MKITPLAADSLGARSMATLVETPDITILLDPSVRLGPYRYDLPPASDRALAPEKIVAGHPGCCEESGCPHGEPLPLRPPQPRGSVDLPRQARFPEGRQVPHQSESTGAFERVRPQAQGVSEGDPSGRRQPDGLRRDGAALLPGGAARLQRRARVRRDDADRPGARSLRPHVRRARPAPEGTPVVPHRRPTNGPLRRRSDDTHAGTLSAGTHETVPQPSCPNPAVDGGSHAHPRPPHPPRSRLEVADAAGLRGRGRGRRGRAAGRRVRRKTGRPTRGEPRQALRGRAQPEKHKWRGSFGGMKWRRSTPAPTTGPNRAKHSAEALTCVR